MRCPNRMWQCGTFSANALDPWLYAMAGFWFANIEPHKWCTAWLDYLLRNKKTRMKTIEKQNNVYKYSWMSCWAVELFNRTMTKFFKTVNLFCIKFVVYCLFGLWKQKLLLWNLNNNQILMIVRSCYVPVSTEKTTKHKKGQRINKKTSTWTTAQRELSWQKSKVSLFTPFIITCTNFIDLFCFVIKISSEKNTIFVHREE